jgi:hypothetical protein
VLPSLDSLRGPYGALTESNLLGVSGSADEVGWPAERIIRV